MRRMLCLAAGLMLLCGCGVAAKEPDHMALVRVLGVDGAGPVELTAVCGGTDQENQSRGACTGTDFEAARGKLPWSGDMELALVSVSYLLVGCDTDLEQLLQAVLEDAELGATATVWLTGDAGELLAESDDPASELELLTRSGVAAPTVAEAYAQLCAGRAVALPRLQGQNGRLICVGDGVWTRR